jgi:hypothetical protein
VSIFLPLALAVDPSLQIASMSRILTSDMPDVEKKRYGWDYKTGKHTKKQMRMSAEHPLVATEIAMSGQIFKEEYSNG